MAAPLILARTFKDAHAYARDVLGLSIGYYRVVNSPGTIKAVRGADIHLVPGWDKRPDRFSMKGAMRYCRNRIVDVAAQESAPADDLMHGHFDGDVLHDVVEGASSTDEESKVTCTFCLEIIESLPRPELTTIQINVVPDDTPVPQHHVDMVAAVTGRQIGTIDETPVIEHESEEAASAASVADFFKVDPAEPDPTDENRPTVVSPEAEALAAEKPKNRRRSKCKSCGALHYKDEPCPESESA